MNKAKIFYGSVQYEFDHYDPDEERYHPQPQPCAGYSSCWLPRDIEPNSLLESRPAQVTFLSPDDDHGEDEQPHQTERE